MAHEGPPAEGTKYPNNPNKLSPEPTSPHLINRAQSETLTDVHSHVHLRHYAELVPREPIALNAIRTYRATSRAACLRVLLGGMTTLLAARLLGVVGFSSDGRCRA